MRTALLSASEDVGGNVGVPAERAIFVELDLSSLASVKACAEKVRGVAAELEGGGGAARVPPALHALVCNAGAFHKTRTLTADRLEMNFGSNLLAHLLLAALLRPLLLQAATRTPQAETTDGQARGGRIVHVASSMHKNCRAADLLADPMCERGAYGMVAAYEHCKLGQVMMACELQRVEAQAGSGLTHVSLHPGNAQTEVSNKFPFPLHQLYVALQPLLRCAQCSLADAASTSTFAVAAPDVAPLRGAYLERSTPTPIADDATDTMAGRQLRELCDGLLKAWL